MLRAASDRGGSEGIIHKELVTLRAALKLARRAGLWNVDPAALLPVAFAPEYKPRSRCLTRRELARLLAELSPDRAARVAFMVATSAELSAPPETGWFRSRRGRSSSCSATP
ncbi:MAG: hypothetical protein IPF99_30345 [Deltaproteobacteria bacterium]|nr:hypothetical protein [Deltaproteobacteria bacterium]MBK7068069.1 hypothetical protein [Deltaproteobacteria bacterium]MBP6830191.1 hypothetical protein [Deltaproteobacteria bacterium]